MFLRRLAKRGVAFDVVLTNLPAAGVALNDAFRGLKVTEGRRRVTSQGGDEG